MTTTLRTQSLGNFTLCLLKLLMFYMTNLIGCNNERSKQLEQKFGNTYEYINNAVKINET